MPRGIKGQVWAIMPVLRECQCDRSSAAISNPVGYKAPESDSYAANSDGGFSAAPSVLVSYHGRHVKADRAPLMGKDLPSHRRPVKSNGSAAVMQMLNPLGQLDPTTRVGGHAERRESDRCIREAGL